MRDNDGEWERMRENEPNEREWREWMRMNESEREWKGTSENDKQMAANWRMREYERE